MVMKKRGLSEIVTVTLVVLLAIAAVVIVWTFVRGTLQNAGEQITSDCVNVDVQPSRDCVAASGAVSVFNGAGGVTIDAVKLIYYDSNGDSVIRDGSCTNIEPLATVSCTPASAPGNSPVEVGVAAVLGDVTCPVTSGRAQCS